MNKTHIDSHHFSTDPTGLPVAVPREIVELSDGDTYRLRIAPLAKVELQVSAMVSSRRLGGGCA